MSDPEPEVYGPRLKLECVTYLRCDSYITSYHRFLRTQHASKTPGPEWRGSHLELLFDVKILGDHNSQKGDQ